MAMSKPQASKSKQGFTAVANEMGENVFYVMQKQADYPTAMKLLDEAGLAPLTHMMAIDLLMEEVMEEDTSLKNKLEGKWFWLAGDGSDILAYSGLNLGGLFTMCINWKFTLNEHGVLVGAEEFTPSREVVKVCGGENHLWLFVEPNPDVEGQSLFLSANDEPRNCDSPQLIVGIKKPVPYHLQDLPDLRVEPEDAPRYGWHSGR